LPTQYNIDKKIKRDIAKRSEKKHSGDIVRGKTSGESMKGPDGIAFEQRDWIIVPTVANFISSI
jgi:hypothetical protein